MNVLTKLWETEQRECIYVHREINLHGLEEYTIPIGELVTKPKEDYLISSIDKISANQSKGLVVIDQSKVEKLVPS